MVDLSVDFAGLELKNPLVVASADIGRDIRQIKKAQECGASAVILKGILPDDSSELKSIMRVLLDEKGQTVYGAAGASRLSYTQGIEVIRSAKQETRMKIGACIPYLPLPDRNIIADAAKSTAKAGADFIEVNFKPQVNSYLNSMEKIARRATDTEMDANEVGEEMRNLLLEIAEGVNRMKQAVNIPVIAKLSPDGVDVLSQAMVARKAGADAIDAIGSMNGAFQIDIHSGGKMTIPRARSGVFLLSGALLKPYSQNAVSRISKTLTVPVLGTGGLMSWTDVVEMLMFGATAVSFCALLMIHGFEALRKIEGGLKDYMEQHDYRNIDDFRNKALSYIAPSMGDCEIIPSVAKIDPALCNGCGRCLRLAHCLAISLTDDRAHVDEAECLGCGACHTVCPCKAVKMMDLDPWGALSC